MVPDAPEHGIPTEAAGADVDVRAAADGDLARRAGRPGRDAAAEGELCRRFAPRIRLYGLKHLRDEERARDLVQSVLLVVLEAVRAGRVDEPEHIDRFVLGASRNLALQARRADGRARPTDTAQLDAHIGLAAVLPETDAVDVGAMQRCLQRLDVRARTVLHLAFTRDKPAAEIARALETTAGNVRVLRHRAVAQLRRCLDGDGGKEEVVQ